MATPSRKVTIVFEGDDRVSHVVNSISGNLSDFSSRVSSVTGPLANLTTSILKVEAAAAALAAGGLLLAFRESVNLETAQVSLSKILSDQDKIFLPNVTKRINELSNEFGQSQVEFTEGATNFKKAGFQIQEVGGLIEDTAKLVIAGAEANLDMNLATELIIATMKGFKAPAEDASRLVDILNKVSNEYATSVSELGIGMSKLSPIAKQMGFSMEETAGVLVPVIEIFRSGDEAAVAMRTGLLKLVDDAKPVRDALANLGISQTDVNGKLRSGKDILFDVAEAFKTADEDAKLFLAAQLVGIRQAAKMVEVFNGLEYTTQITNTALNATGSATLEVEARFKTAQIAIDRMIAGLQNMGVAVGDEFRVALKGAIDGTTAIENELERLVRDGAFDPLLNLVEDAANSIGDTLKTVAKNLPEALEGIDWTGFIASIESVSDEFTDLIESFFGDIDLSTVGGLTEFIQNVVDKFTAFNNLVAGILEGLEPFIRKLGELVTKFQDSGEEGQKLVGQFLGMATGINTLVNAVPLLTGALNLLAGAIGALSLTRIPGAIAQLGLLSGSVGSVATSLTVLGPLIAAVAVGGYALAEWAYESDTAFTRFIDSVNNTVAKLRGLDEQTIKNIESQAEETAEAGRLAVAFVKLKEAVDGVPEERSTDVMVKGSLEYSKAVIDMTAKIKALPETKDTSVTASADTASAKKAVETLFIEIEDPLVEGQYIQVPVKTTADQKSIDDTQKALEKVEGEKVIIARLQNETEVAITQIETRADVLKSAFEWSAKVDIAEVEQHLETVRTLSNNLTTSFENTGTVIAAMVSELGELGGYEAFKVLEFMAEESERRDKLLEAQLKLTDAEVAWMAAKTKMLNSGSPAISISMEGVYPELEQIMWNIIERIQIQVNHEGLDMLLGG